MDCINGIVLQKGIFMKQELIAKMNAYLANQEIMYIKLHNMH